MRSRGRHAGAPSRRWRVDWVAVLLSVLALGGLGAILYPQAAQWFTAVNQAGLVSEYKVSVDAASEAENTRLLENARRYNRGVNGMALVAPASNLPELDSAGIAGSDADGVVPYEDQLRVDGTEAMGRLVVPSASIDLPILHGTEDETLSIGVGHLEGTALPVGGAGLRPVLTAHRGLAESRLFNNLDRVTIGDTFTVEVAGQALVYRVIDTQVVEPDQTEKILPVTGQDLITLVTCTPLGVNSHRILVTGERVDVAAPGTEAGHGPGFPWWAAIAAVAVLLAGGYVWASGYRRRKQDDGPDAAQRRVGAYLSRKRSTTLG